jgi:hypothetical protein
MFYCAIEKCTFNFANVGLRSCKWPSQCCQLMCAVMLIAVQPVQGQAAQKSFNHQSQVWTSINSTVKLNKHWGLLGDFHVRRTNFVRDPSFYFLRVGGAYFFQPKLSIAAGYAHMWLASKTVNEEFVFGNENRVYQQVQVSTSFKKQPAFTVLQRIRNEQRWQQKVVGGIATNAYRFTNRLRYLISFSIPVFKSPTLPKLMIADELLLHFGKEVRINAFDQNRLTIGIQQRINKNLSFDFGYMYLVQRKIFGYQYDVNHTLRLFFYYNASLKPRNLNAPGAQHHHSGEE